MNNSLTDLTKNFLSLTDQIRLELDNLPDADLIKLHDTAIQIFWTLHAAFERRRDIDHLDYDLTKNKETKAILTRIISVLDTIRRIRIVKLEKNNHDIDCLIDLMKIDESRQKKWWRKFYWWRNFTSQHLVRIIIEIPNLRQKAAKLFFKNQPSMQLLVKLLDIDGVKNRAWICLTHQVNFLLDLTLDVSPRLDPVYIKVAKNLNLQYQRDCDLHFIIAVHGFDQQLKKKAAQILLERNPRPATLVAIYKNVYDYFQQAKNKLLQIYPADKLGDLDYPIYID